MSCNKMWAVMLAAGLLLGLLTGCGGEAWESSSAYAPETDTVETVEGLDTGEMFTDRDKEDTYDQQAATQVPLDGTDSSSAGTTSAASSSTASGTAAASRTITKEGEYVLTGKLDGQVVVNAPKTAKIQLVLDGVTIDGGTSAAIYIKQADKVFITLAAGSQNTITTAKAFVATDENNVDGALFSKEDLTINGSGSLTVNCAEGHGIVSKDSLVITGGSYTIAAAGHAIQAKDDVRISGGTFHLTAGKDGIHAENTEDTSLGYVYVAGGTFTVTADGDGFSASGKLQLDKGTGTITTGGGAGQASSHSQQGGFGGWWGGQSTTSTDDTSSKGLKAGDNLVLAGGTWTLDTADDGLHSNGSLAVSGGTVTVASGDDGVHADATTTITGGQLTITQSYEGIEGKAVEIAGGTISLVASDDGINAAGGQDESGFGGYMHQDNFASDGSSYIRITGGKLTVDASGDGLDSNGNLYVSGGETYVSGPTNSGNGALDYDSTAQVTGGIFVAAGASGMAQGFTQAENQGAIFVSTGFTQQGEIVLKDASGKTLLAWTPAKSYSSVVISCPGIVKGETYTLSLGSISDTVTMSDWIYGTSSGMGGGMGGMGRPGGRR